MSTLSKKLFISILTLVLTVGAFTATTFAWFTLGNTATVGQFNGEVTAGDGLEVRLGTTGAWTNFISTTDIQNYINAQHGNNTPILTAITSTNGMSFTKVGFDSNDDLVSGLTVLATDYITFDLYFRSAEAGKVQLSNITLASTDAAWINDGNSFKLNTTTTVNQNGSITEQASHAARVSIANGTTALVLEQNDGDGNLLGSAANVAYGAHDFFKSRFNTDIQDTYDDLFNAKVLPSVVKTPSQITAAAEDVVTLEDTTSENGYHTGMVTVNVWLEGWDNNTFNAIFSAQLHTTLTFKKAE